MIKFYKHQNFSDILPEEIDLLGFNGIKQFASEAGIDPNLAKKFIDEMEMTLKTNEIVPFDMSTPENSNLFNEWVDKYIEFFNKYSKYDKQAYIVIGNIASGKNTFSNEIEKTTHSMIVDSDRFKMGEETQNGYFEGFTSLYHEPIDRERMQKPCSLACEKTLYTAADQGLNVILPRATKNMDKLNKETEYLLKKGYDIHLILIDAPISDCADRNYYRYLIREYNQMQDYNGRAIHGRFVPVSVIKTIGDNPYTIFAKSLGDKRYKSFNAFFSNNSKSGFEKIDIDTMQF